MRPVRLALALLLLFSAVSLFAVTRTIRIFDKRQVVIAVPEGWKFELTKDKKTGLQTIQLDDRNGVRASATFHPDPENALASEEALDERARGLFAPVGEETRFTVTKTVDGFARHAVVDDATKGIRSWPGVYLVFTVTGEDRESEAYARAIEVITEGLREVAK